MARASGRMSRSLCASPQVARAAIKGAIRRGREGPPRFRGGALVEARVFTGRARSMTAWTIGAVPRARQRARGRREARRPRLLQARGQRALHGHVKPKKKKSSSRKNANVAVALSAKKARLCCVVDGRWNAGAAARTHWP
eukprot:4269859-Pyramimonas_sp.AAC.1